MYHRDLHSVDPNMMAFGGPITASVASNTGQSGLTRSHLSGGKTGNSRPAATRLENPQRSSVTIRDSESDQSHALLGKFTGYSSSGEEDEGEGFEAKRKPITHQPFLASNNSRKSKKIRQPKSAELVVSDTDDVGESEPCSVTAPILLQKKDINSQSPVHRSISSVRTKRAKQGRAPRFRKTIVGSSSSVTIESKSHIAASASQRKPTTVNNKAMRATGQKGAKQPARSVMVKKQSIRHGPFIIDSDTESDGGSNSEGDNSTDVEAEERGLEEDEDGDDNWDAVPPTRPPERQSLDKRKAVSAAPRPSAQQPSSTTPKAASEASSQRAPAFDKAKLKAMLLAKKKNHPKFHVSTGAPTEGQSVLAATKISAKSGQDPPKPRTDSQPAQQRNVSSTSLGGSKLQSVSAVAPRASLSSQASGAELQLSASTKPVSKAARPAGVSSNEASTSGCEFGPTQSLSKQDIARKHNLEASRARQPPKCTTQGSTPIRKQNRGQSAGSIGLVGSLIQGIRQSEKPIDGASKITAVPAVESNLQPQHYGQTWDRPQTVKKNPQSISDVDPRSDGVLRAKPNATTQSSGSSTNVRAGAVVGQNRVIQSRNPGIKSSGRTEVTQAHGIGVASSNPQASPNMIPILKRKAAAVGSISASEMPLQKKPNRSIEEPSSTASSTMDPRIDMVMGGANVLSSTKSAFGTSTARKPAATAPSSANTESNSQSLASRTPVYKALHSPLENISGSHDTQTATPKKDLAPTRPKIGGLFKTKEPAVKTQAQMSQTKTVAPLKASVSVVIPATTDTVLATSTTKNAADTKDRQNSNRVSEKPFDDNMINVRPVTSGIETQRTAEKPPGSMDNTELPAKRGSNVATLGQRFAKDSESIEKVAQKASQPQTVEAILSSIPLLTDQPLPSIKAGKATTSVKPKQLSNLPEVTCGPGSTSAKGAPDAEQSTYKGKERCSDVADSVVPSPRLDNPAQLLIHSPKAAPKILAEGSLLKKDTCKKNGTPSHKPTAATAAAPALLANTVSAPVINLSFPSHTSDAEPYFEYSVFYKIWPASGDESFVDAIELTSIPCTNIDEANTHVETLFRNAREQYQQHFSVQFSEWANKPDDHGCNAFLGTFAPIEYPSKKSCMKFWVERHTVSAEAGRSPKGLKHTSFVAKTVYVLRLFRLLPAPTDSEGENEDSSVPPSDATNTVAFTRIYHPLPGTECYTALDAANRAAKNLQIEMSHKPNPTGADKFWQMKDLAELNQKAKDLRQAKDGQSKYWKSKFNGSGLGSKFELVVEKAGLCGPRNL